MNKWISTKNRIFITLVGPSETRKSELIFNLLKKGTFQPKIVKIYFFYQHHQPLYGVMQKEIEKLVLVHSVMFEFIDSLKDNSTKFSLFSDESYEEMCISKLINDIATAGRHRWLSSYYLKHKLFHHSKRGRDVEHQNTLIVVFESPVIWCKLVRLVHNWDSDQS